jgi:hypothetical protein
MAVGCGLRTLGDVRAIAVLGCLLAFAVAACAPAVDAAAAAKSAPPVPPSIDYTTPEPPPLGLITFGQSFDPLTKRALQVRTQFTTDDPEIAWSTSLLQAVATKKLQMLIASRSAAGTERMVARKDVKVDDPTSDVFATKSNLAATVDRKAGTYVLRYLREGMVIAEGTFTLVAP